MRISSEFNKPIVVPHAPALPPITECSRLSCHQFISADIERFVHFFVELESSKINTISTNNESIMKASHKQLRVLRVLRQEPQRNSVRCQGEKGGFSFIII